MSTQQQKIDLKNKDFWNELCGTHLANQLGINDDSPDSLKKFDDWYMNFYPYLYDFIPFAKLASKKVLEIGLGYGTIAQKLIENNADYYGLDISPGPVSMIQHRSNILNKKTHSQIGSALNIPYSDQSFDYFISIGCLHHTGDLKKALTEVFRVLKQDGQAIIMLYNALSYRNWIKDFSNTLKRISSTGVDWDSKSDKIRKLYDHNSNHESAPYTCLVTKKELNQYLSNFCSHVTIKSTNIGDELLGFIPRNLKNTLLGPYIGLDLYITCKKKHS